MQWLDGQLLAGLVELYEEEARQGGWDGANTAATHPLSLVPAAVSWARAWLNARTLMGERRVLLERRSMQP